MHLEDAASKFCRMMREHSSYKVGLIAKTTTSLNSFMSGLKTQKQEERNAAIQEKLPVPAKDTNFGTRLLKAMNAGTSSTSKESWALRRKSQPKTVN